MAVRGAEAASNLKLVLLAGGFLLLLAAGMGFLLLGPERTHPAVRFVHGAAADFVERDADAFLDRAEFPLSASIDGGADVYTREVLAGAVQRAFSRLSYLNIRPEEATVREIPGSEEVEVEYHFHWTASRDLYPNMRSRSEDRTEDGRPALAIIRLRPAGNSWLVTEAHLETRR